AHKLLNHCDELTLMRWAISQRLLGDAFVEARFHGQNLVRRTKIRVDPDQARDLTLIIDSASASELLARNDQGHLIEMPPRRWSWGPQAGSRANNGANL